jgi:hypothetical protein
MNAVVPSMLTLKEASIQEPSPSRILAGACMTEVYNVAGEGVKEQDHGGVS